MPPYFANLYAPPFSTERWNAGRACIRDSQPQNPKTPLTVVNNSNSHTL